ncbi:MAG TPA: hypothetical protein VFR31_13175 [Thermoanaerobaculia bacterium]|nr:hypothetical protein [Thermoanaerobaculia bacterium]
MLAALLLAVTAAPPPPLYRIDEIAVLGGNPVAGQVDGMLYKGTPADCTTPPNLEILPVSTFLAANTKLRVRIAGCQTGLPEPRVDCLLMGKPVQFKGWTHDLPMSLPDRTGVHSFALACSAGRQGMGDFTADLYLTLKAPRPIFVDPPPAQWYELVTSWASGFEKRADESAVLHTILAQTYEYGQQKWRYGFCKKKLGGKCVFGPTTIDAKDLLCGPDGQSDFCRCHWYQILPGGTPPGCDFSTCFGFSDVFEFLSALMGIGGMRDVVVEGKYNNGFQLHPWARAIDPALLGFIHCGYRDLLCLYVFLNHDLRQRGHRIYDTTFGRTYLRLDELVAQNVVSWQGKNAMLENRAACYRNTGYGEWFYYDLAEEVALCETRDQEPVRPPDPALGIPPPPASIDSISLDRNERQLEAAAVVDVKLDGSYSMDARLAVEGRTLAYGNSTVTLARGKQSMTASLELDALSQLQDRSGAAKLTVVLYSQEPLRHLDDEEIDVTALPD